MCSRQQEDKSCAVPSSAAFLDGLRQLQEVFRTVTRGFSSCSVCQEWPWFGTSPCWHWPQQEEAWRAQSPREKKLELLL